MLDASSTYLPSPLERSESVTARSRKETNSSFEAFDEPSLLALAFKVATHPSSASSPTSGVLGQGRLRCSGHQCDQGKKERLASLFQCTPTRRIRSRRLPPVTYAAIGLKDTTTGDTLTTRSIRSCRVDDLPRSRDPGRMSPRRDDQGKKLSRAIQKLARGRPTSSQPGSRYGQTIIGGMGELHLDTR